jgi:tetratricopeptide (TPR) repeat protein
LLGLLVRGASPQEIATLAGRISGTRIRIPAGYEKKSGIAFEAEQRTFAYAFRENFLPLIRVVAITLLAGALFGFLGYNYIYRPVAAFANYRAGYAQIANDRFTIANERFARAASVWPSKRWYYRYAEAFADRRAYQLAEQKYEDLLKSWPGDKKGILDYAQLESTRLADYAKADGLLKRYLDAHMYDYEALLASGDNYLRWAERDKTKYEPARLAYATLLDRYGVKDELLFRMLRYFIRTDNGNEVERLRAFYAARPDVKVDASAFAELGGYLIDHRRLDFAQDVLLRADAAQHGLYEVHYNLARYYRIVQDPDDEKKALDATKQILDLTRNTDPLTARRLSVEIDTHTRLGEYYYRRHQYLPAQTELQEAIRLVETNQRMGLIDKGPLYGRPYAALGDLAYYIEDNLQEAARQYQNAAANSFTSPLLTYKIGYVQYSQGNYKDALASFADAEDASAYPSSADLLGPEALPAGRQTAQGQGGQAAEIAQPANAQALSPVGQPPQNLLYALGDAFYQRGDYFAAQASFLRLRARLETRRAALGILHPEDRPDDRALLDMLVKVNNNLGVTMFRLGEKTADRNKKSEALVYLSAANEIASSLARGTDTVRRSEDRNLPSLNMRGILYPLSGFVLEIYSDLPRDFQAADW